MTAPTARRVTPASAAGARRLDALPVASVGFVLAVATARDQQLGRAVVGALALIVLSVVTFRSRKLALSFTVAWLVLLGFTRRFLIPFIGWSENDPLLLVAPALAVVMLLARRRDGVPPRTLLSSLFVFQLLWAATSPLNPNQLDLVEGLRGASFFVVPLLWFFVGRRLDGGEHDAVHRMLLVMAVPVVLLGAYHTFVGLLPFEYTWLSVADVPPSLIFVGGFNIRPFSTLTSPQEYGVLLILIAIVILVRLLHGTPRAGRWSAALAVVVVMLFLQGSRGAFLAFLLAAGLVVTLRQRRATVPLLGVTVLLAVSFSVMQGLDFKTDPQGATDSTSAALWRHQLEGLLNPTSSTAGLHADLYAQGFADVARHPLGLGPSQYQFTYASDELVPDEDDQLSPESQLPIVLAALGLPAGVALVLIYLTAVVYAVTIYREDPTPRHLAWFGFLVAVGDQALNGRLYLSSAIVALSLGGLATTFGRRRQQRLTTPRHG